MTNHKTKNALTLKNAISFFDKKDFASLVDDFIPLVYLSTTSIEKDIPKHIEIHLFVDGSILVRSHKTKELIPLLDEDDLYDYVENLHMIDEEKAILFARTFDAMMNVFSRKVSLSEQLSDENARKIIWTLYQKYH